VYELQILVKVVREGRCRLELMRHTRDFTQRNVASLRQSLLRTKLLLDARNAVN
jgi:hypothetical protein